MMIFEFKARSKRNDKHGDADAVLVRPQAFGDAEGRGRD